VLAKGRKRINFGPAIFRVKSRKLAGGKNFGSRAIETGDAGRGAGLCEKRNKCLHGSENAIAAWWKGLTAGRSSGDKIRRCRNIVGSILAAGRKRMARAISFTPRGTDETSKGKMGKRVRRKGD